MSPSRTVAGGTVKNDDGSLVRAEWYRLVEVSNSGYLVLMEREEMVDGTNLTRNLRVYFPFGTITTTQAFGSLNVTGEYR